MYDYLLNKSVLIIGPPRSDKLLFAEQFFVEGFKKGELGIYILTNDFSENIVQKIRKMHGIGNFHVDNGLIKIIDCYSPFIGVPKKESAIIKNVAGPYALNEISIALANVIARNSRVVLDSATTLLLQNPINLAEKFFQAVIGKIKFYDSTFFIILEEGTHDTREITVLESMTNVTLYFRQEDDNKFIEMKDAVMSRKIPYEIENNNIAFKKLVEA